MREKEVLLSKLVKSLLDSNYQVLFYGKCFDLFAKKEERWIIKVLYNLDAFDEKTAKNMRILSYFTSSYPFVVAEISNNGTLEDGILYSRFNIYSSNLETFLGFLERKSFSIFTKKGKVLVKIDCEKMKSLRKRKNLSLYMLAKQVNISKKALYEIENNLVTPTKETVERIESILGEKIEKEVKIDLPEKEILVPKTNLEKKVSFFLKKIGIENSSLELNFNLVGRCEESVFVVSKRIDFEEEKKIQEISDFVNAISFSILEKTRFLSHINLKELKKISSFDELKEKILE